MPSISGHPSTAFAAAPLPLSSVTLAGEFAAMQAANREVLLSLNMSRWACHFTTTANLTSCRSAAVPWHTYLKNATVPFGFVHEDGFLGAGDDLAPPSDLLFPDCAASCAGARACVGFCFEAPSEQPAEKVKCYLKTAAHFTPQRRKANCLTNGPLSPRASHRSAPLLDPLNFSGFLPQAPPPRRRASRCPVRWGSAGTTATTRATGCRRRPT